MTKTEDKKQDAVVAYDYGQDRGAGYEGTTQADFMIPFIALLQANSPQCAEGDPKAMASARPGMLLNTATQELISGKDGIVIVPVLRQHVFVEWVPRQDGGGGGGFVAVHEEDSEVVRKARGSEGARVGKVRLPNGNELVETYYVYALVMEGDEPQDGIVLSFTSTKIKKYRQFMTLLRKEKSRPPLYANRLRLTTVSEQNAKGRFFNFSLAPLNGTVAASLIRPDSPIIAAARDLAESISSGRVKADHESQATTSAGAVETDDIDDKAF